MTCFLSSTCVGTNPDVPCRVWSPAGACGRPPACIERLWARATGYYPLPCNWGALIDIYVNSSILCMPQALVPDINVSVIRYREFMLRSRQDMTPAGFLFGLRGLNGALDSDMQVTFIPRSQYQMMCKSQHVITCGDCGKDIKIDFSKLQTRQAGWLAVATGRGGAAPAVQCGACQYWQRVDMQTSDISVTVVSPLTLTVLPNPPPHSSLADLVYGEHDFWGWCDLRILSSMTKTTKSHHPQKSCSP